MHLVQVARGRTPDGRPRFVDEPGGAVFAPAPARGITGKPVYSYGSGKVKQDHVWTCPVSAIPDEVWQLWQLWLTCRTLEALPKAGGVLDQPEIVRRAFVAFEVERRAVEHAALTEAREDAKR